MKKLSSVLACSVVFAIAGCALEPSPSEEVTLGDSLVATNKFHLLCGSTGRTPTTLNELKKLTDTDWELLFEVKDSSLLTTGDTCVFAEKSLTSTGYYTAPSGTGTVTVKPATATGAKSAFTLAAASGASQTFAVKFGALGHHRVRVNVSSNVLNFLPALGSNAWSSVLPSGTSPVVGPSGLLYLDAGGTVTRLQGWDGRQLWQKAGLRSLHASCAYSDKLFAVTSAAPPQVLAIAAGTGAILNTFNLPADLTSGTEIRCFPSSNGGLANASLVVQASVNGVMQARALNTGTGAVSSASAAYDRMLIAPNGTPYSITETSGVRRVNKLASDGFGSTWSYALPDAADVTVAFEGDNVYARQPAVKLTTLGAGTGAVRSTLALSAGVGAAQSFVVLKGGKVAVAWAPVADQVQLTLGTPATNAWKTVMLSGAGKLIGSGDALFFNRAPSLNSNAALLRLNPTDGTTLFSYVHTAATEQLGDLLDARSFVTQPTVPGPRGGSLSSVIHYVALANGQKLWTRDLRTDTLGSPRLVGHAADHAFATQYEYATGKLYLVGIQK
jgi:hypothetical protein